MASYGSAPEDFEAHTVVDYSELNAKMLVNYVPEGSQAPFLTMSDSELVLDMADPNLGNLHQLIQAGIVYDLSSFGLKLNSMYPLGKSCLDSRCC